MAGSTRLRRKDVLKEFCNSTSVKGVKHTVNKKHRGIKIIWVIAVLAFMSLSIAQVTYLLVDYFKYPTVAKLDEFVYYQDAEETGQTVASIFPSVTVCNLTPLSVFQRKPSSSSLPVQSYQEYRDYVNGLMNNQSHTQVPPDIRAELSSVYGYYSFLGVRDVEAVGHKYEELVVSCKFIIGFFGEHVDCRDKASIHRIIRPDFYNCYTISWNISNVAYGRIPRGLSLVLHLGNEEITGMSSDVNIGRNAREEDIGALVALDKPGKHPELNYNNQRIAPGFHFTLGVNEVIRERIPDPYGDCVHGPLDVSEEDGEQLYFYDQLGRNYSYSRTSQIIACTQHAVIKKCGCLDPDLHVGYHPYDPLLYPLCGDTRKGDLNLTVSRVQCMQKVRQQKEAHCATKSRLECREFLMSKDISFSKWPKKSEQVNFYKHFIRNSTLKQRFTILETILQAKETGNDELALDTLKSTRLIEDNFVKLTIVVRNTKVRKMSDVPKWSAFHLLSQVGGALNLYAGISLVFLFEIVETAYFLLFPGKVVQGGVEQSKDTGHDQNDNGINGEVHESVHLQSTPNLDQDTST